MKSANRTGPLGALMDEYERASNELKDILKSTNEVTFIEIVDTQTSDPDCQSIQTIMNHVIGSGYRYANYIRKYFNQPWPERKENYDLLNIDKCIGQFDEMLEYTNSTFEDKWNFDLDDTSQDKIKTSWGQDYDLEQLLEHAIVHILRHRRQIERFLRSMNQ